MLQEDRQHQPPGYSAQESEYAAWVLVNGYALNHTTVAVHRMRGLECVLLSCTALLLFVQPCCISHEGTFVSSVRLACRGGIDDLVSTLQEQAFKLNEAGGVMKVRNRSHHRLHAHPEFNVSPAEPKGALLSCMPVRALFAGAAGQP